MCAARNRLIRYTHLLSRACLKQVFIYRKIVRRIYLSPQLGELANVGRMFHIACVHREYE